MDRRSLLAIGLTFLILIAWQALYVSPRQKELAKQRAIELREKQRADSIAALAQGVAKAESVSTARPEAAPAQGARAGAPAAAPAATEGAALAFEGADTLSGGTVTVTTADMKAVVGGPGGEVESLTLPAFKKKDGSPVELVPAGASGGLEIGVLEGNEWRPLSRSGFEALVDGMPVRDSARVDLRNGPDSTVVTFRRTGPKGELVEKTLTFHRTGYSVGVKVALGREGQLAGTAAYSLAWRCGLSPTEANEKMELTKFAAFGMVGEELYQVPMSKFSKETGRSHDGTVVWAGARTKYFLSALVTTAESRGSGTVSLLGDRGRNFIGYSIAYPFRGDPRRVEDTFTWYAGPLDMKLLKSFNVGMERAIDLGRYLRLFSVWILKLMVWMERWIPNYGVIIIILSVLTKLLFYRLTHKSFKAMKDMQRIQPKLKEIQEKYKGDRERQNKEVMKLYKEAGVSPLGGCLPLLLQMPVFIALYNVLANTIELRGAPFVGWIDDLSVPDTLFGWGSSIPFIGKEFHLLPILMGGAMLYQSKLGGSPTGDAAPAAQSKMMMYLMPIIFTIFFYGMPSGLVLYWLVNNVLSIIQQYYAQKELEREDAARVAPAQ